MSGAPSHSVGLAFRGMWWRKWSSVAIFAVGVACTGVAAGGASFAVNARDAVLQSNVDLAPPDSLGTGVSVSLTIDGTVSRAHLVQQTRQAFGALMKAGFLGAPVVAESGDAGVFDAAQQRIVATVPMVYRDGSCAHVVIASGQCLAESDPHGVVVTQETATSRGWRVGTSVVVGTPDRHTTIHVRGIYQPVQPAGGYWFAGTHEYFGLVAQYASASVPRGDAVLVNASFWDVVAPPRVGDSVTAALDFALAVDRVRLSSVGQLRTLYSVAAERVQTPLRPGSAPPSVETTLPAVLDRSVAAVGSIAAPILVVAAELLILTWLVLYVLLVSSAEARTGEIVLGKLRGLTPRETVLHALLEPRLLVVFAVPVGVGAGALALDAVGASILGPHVALRLPGSAWAAAAFAGLGGLVAAGLAGVGVLRRSVIDQWRRTERRPGRTGWVIEAGVATLAIAAAVELVNTPASLGATAQFLPTSAPGLLAIACALLGVRALPLLARTGFRSTRGSSHVAAFVALRQIGRRAGNLRVFVLLTVAVAQVVFGIASRSVFTSNQMQRALTEVGAARVLSVSAARGVDPSAVVARLDPSGRWASAGSLSADSSSSDDESDPSAALLVIDPETFAAIAFWRSDFGSAPRLADQLAPLASAPPSLVDVQATSLTIVGTVHVEADGPVELHAGLTDSSGAAVDVTLGTIAATPPGTPPQAIRFTAAVPGCAGGCLFRRLSLFQPGFQDTPPKASIAVTAIDAASGAGTRALLPAIRATTWTSPDTNSDGTPALAVRSEGAGLTFTFAPSFAPQNAQTGYEIVSNVPEVIPALVTTALPTSQQKPLTLGVTQGLALPVDPTLVHVLPRAGDLGVLISRAWLPAARPDGYDHYLANQVWLSAAAPADFATRLSAAGLVVRTTQLASTRAKDLAAQGPAYAVDMLLFGAGAVVALAVAGAATTLLVAARRRLYEMAAIRSLGVRPARVLGSLVLEHGAVTAAASALGLVAGLAGAHIALARLPEFADDPRVPRLVLDLPVLRCAALALAAVAIGGLVLVRQASPSRLREAQQ